MSNSTKIPGMRAPALAIGLFLLMLAVLFLPSFHPNKVLFANDAPLGAVMAHAEDRVSGFTGFWQHLNWLGMEQPSAMLSISMGVYALFGPFFFAKFIAPLSLFILGVSAWFFFRQLGFRPVVCILGGIAAMLNTGPFSYACWGLPYLSLVMAAAFLALAALVSAPRDKPWIKAALAGMAVGLGIMEGYDTGAIFSLYIAAFALASVFFFSNGTPGKKAGLGLLRVLVVAFFAAFVAAQALTSLVGTQVKGVAAFEEQRSKEEQWNWATQWSLPKRETLRVIIPGVYGYRMDTPEGGNYWGAVGQTPGYELHGQGIPRHSGSGVYAGVLVVLVAFWALFQSFRSRGGIYSDTERKWIWFWGAVALISLLFAFGRHAPFYQIIYSLPYFSTIRNPIKYMSPFHLGLLVLFGYGLQGLFAHYLSGAKARAASLGAHLKSWWDQARGFDRKWVIGSFGAVIVSVMALFIYMASRQELQSALQQSGFDAAMAEQITHFSIGEVGWFVLFLAASAVSVLLVMSGWLNDHRVKWAGLLLGGVLVLDLARANQPWIVYWDYTEKYASNPVLETLRENTQEQRVTAKLSPMAPSYLVAPEGQFFAAVHNEWLQHHFQYFRIQTLDIIQMPRAPQLDQAFLDTFMPRTEQDSHRVGRLWQLTNTRLILGQTQFTEMLNQQIDPQHRRFRVHTSFDIVPKDPRAAGNGGFRLEDLTARANPNGAFSIIEFTGALPRAQLYSNWQPSIDDKRTLELLAARDFNPRESVVISGELTGPNPSDINAAEPGDVEIVDYSPKRIRLRAQPATRSVLLLNDRYHQHWNVYVGGQREPLLRANYIMRGVLLPAGSHEVEFRFEPPATGFYMSLVALLLGIGLLVYLQIDRGRKRGVPSLAHEAASNPKLSLKK